MSQMINLTRSTVFVLLVFSLFIPDGQQLVDAYTRGPKIIKILIDKLEAYAAGITASSGLTVQEIQEADEEFQSWPLESRKLALEKPQLRLLLDLVIHPVQSIEYQYEKEDYDLFIKRVEANYAEFRPVYVDSERFVNVKPVRAARTNDLLERILNNDPMLSHLHFERAKNEYDSWNRKYEELVFHEDIVGQLSVLRELFNFFNSKYNAVLRLDVYPLLETIRDGKQLRDLFLQALQKRFNIVIMDGQFTEIITKSADDSDLDELDPNIFDLSQLEPSNMEFLPKNLQNLLEKSGFQIQFSSKAPDVKADTPINKATNKVTSLANLITINKHE